MAGRRIWVRVVPLAVLVAVVLGALALPDGSLPIRATAGLGAPRGILVDGQQREYLLHLPPHRSGPLPLLVALHGAGGSGPGMEEDTGFSSLADDHGFAVAYPTGRFETWNAGGCCLRAVAEEVPDVEFLTAMVRQLVLEGVVDASRVYVTGFSNGGMMAARLACEGVRLAGIAVVGGAVVSPCPATTVRTVLLVHGTADPMVPPAGYDGVLKTGQHLTYPPLDASADRWRTLLVCASPPDEGTADGVAVRRWDRCAAGQQVERVELAGMGHAWPGNRALPTPDDRGFDASAAVVRAFGLAP